MAALVAAGSARMTTRVPVTGLAVPPGAIQMTWQPEAEPGDELLAVGVLGALVLSVGDNEPFSS
jgi:hypothetical protein